MDKRSYARAHIHLVIIIKKEERKGILVLYIYIALFSFLSHMIHVSNRKSLY